MCYQPDTNETRNKQNQKKIMVIRKKVTKRDKTWMTVTRVCICLINCTLVRRMG